MSKFTTEEKKELIEEVFKATDKSIQKTRLTMCRMEDHKWRKVNDHEIACGVCPTMLIVENADDYVESGTSPQ